MEARMSSIPLLIASKRTDNDALQMSKSKFITETPLQNERKWIAYVYYVNIVMC